MKIFIDTADVEQIKKYARTGIIDGVTTNPALIAKENRSFKEIVMEITDIVNGPVSVEVIDTDVNGMLNEARKLASIHENIVVKIPATMSGIEAVSTLSKEGIRTNVTIVYKANQALLAAKVGATYVSLFVGRLDATSIGGVDLIKEVVSIYKNFGFSTQVLAASMRNEVYVKQAALSGAHVATVPPEVLEKMMESEMTQVGLSDFLDQWNALPEDKRKFDI